MFDIAELLQHWYANRPKAVIAESLGVDRATVRKYIGRAEGLGLKPGGPPLSQGEWDEVARRVAPELMDPKVRSLTYSLIDPLKDKIDAMLEASTVTTVHQRLRDEQGLAVGISSFRRYCHLVFPDKGLRDKVTILRPDVDPGEEAQVDYGFLGTFTDRVTGKMRRVWAFVIVLSFSRHMFVRPVLKMDQVSWVAAHAAAFEYFGGVPQRLVMDNLKTGVLKPDIYDPKLNRTYAEMGNHFGCLLDPARAGKPKDKPRVERPMPYVRDSFWSGRDFGGEQEMQVGAIKWCDDVAGVRHHRSIEGQMPLEVFATTEKDKLTQLPLLPFELARWSRPKVGVDCYAKVGKALYTVPWHHIGSELDAREGYRTVEFFREGVVVKTWPRFENGRHYDWADYPPEKAAFYMKNPSWCRHRASQIGGAVTEVANELLANGALYNLRSVQGILRLADTVGAQRLEKACRRAVVIGDPAYRTIKGILAAGTENDGDEETRPVGQPAHLHGQEKLFDHLEASAS